jgi:nucleoside-diphosphate-sugar epimerase
MNIAVTGATGFLGRYIVNRLTEAGNQCRCWYRPESDRTGFSNPDSVEWVPGSLGDEASTHALVSTSDAVIHAALYRPGAGFRGSEGDMIEFADVNVVGTIRLIEASRKASVPRFVYISTCAVHEVILDDRPLDEAHPSWAKSHYGAHKAAVEMFVHSYGLGHGYDICALRPTGIYGLTQPPSKSKWFDIVRDVKEGKSISSAKGGKEVHAADVAQAAQILLTADGVAGQVYNCYDMYIADQQVARIAKELTGSTSTIADLNKGPKNQIVTDKLRALGMTFGGEMLLKKTVSQMLESI